jgi:membrane protein
LVNAFGHRFNSYAGLPPAGLEIVNNLVSLAVFALIIYLLYRVVPDVQIPRKIVLVTSLMVALLFLAGKVVLAVVIGHNGTASAYGAAASLVTLMLWAYYSAQIMFLGAEGMKVYAYKQALVYRPKKHSLKRETIHIDHHGLPGRVSEAFARGFKKRSD